MSHRDTGGSVREVLKRGRDRLGGGDDGFREAEILLSDLLGIDRVSLYRDNLLLSSRELEAYQSRIDRRAAGEPVQYILGQVQFLDTLLHVGPGVLIPRPETELWLADLLAWWQRHRHDPPEQIIDLCTGSGCLAIGLARQFPRSRVVAVDRSEAALAYARRNVLASGLDNVDLICSDLLSFLRPGSRSADLVVCNPPYISSAEFMRLDVSVRDFEPSEALLGGDDGLSYYRQICSCLPGLLSNSAVMAFETGAGQGCAVADLLAQAGFGDIRMFRDLGGHDRAVFGVKSASLPPVRSVVRQATEALED